MTDGVVLALLDRLTPNYDHRVGDWDRVVADARLSTRRRLATPLRLGALLATVAAAAALVLAWPFGTERGSVLDRALAAAGDGPVLHAVLRGEWGGTLVRLDSGERKPVYGDNEVWFDTRTGQTHQIERLGNVVQNEELYTPNKPAAELAALGREYREALESGTARITGQAELDGEPVVWITIHSELLPDVADNKDHEWAQQVAVSNRTYKAVALRETRDGRPGPDTLQRVLDLKLLPRDQADFTTTRPSLNGTAFKQARERIELDQAAAVLGRPPLWLGRDYDGLQLSAVYRETTSSGHQDRVRLSGAKAQAAIKCSQMRGEAAGLCFRQLGFSSVEVRPDGVYTSRGPIEWKLEQSSVVLVYGDTGGAYVPLDGKHQIVVTESLQASAFRRGAGTYVPPPGSVFLAAGASGYLQRDGVQIGIEGGSENDLIAAAHALTPLP
jgi:hypothetical protein